MADIAKEIGAKIKYYRKQKQMTLQEMAGKICKSAAALSKYENGQISMDILTLYDIAAALGVHVEQLLYSRPLAVPQKSMGHLPGFFKDLSQFYIYYYDGRNSSLSRCVVDVLGEASRNEYRVMMYMNIESYEHYQNCENTYWGFLKHYDAVSNLTLQNRDTAMEQITISMLASYLESSTKMGLFCGLSSRPMMPVSLKVLISREIQKETPELIRSLQISKEDIKMMKLYNMLVVI